MPIDARQDRTGATTAERRAVIIATAAAQFAEFGYQGTSLRQVAAGCGLAPGHLYYYYRSKHDLLVAVMRTMQEFFTEAMARAGERPGTSVDRFRGLIAEHVTILCERRVDAVVSYESIRFVRPEFREELVGARDAYETGLRGLIDACRDEIPVSTLPTALLGKLVLGLANWPYQWFRPDGALSSAQLADAIADRAVALLRADAATSPR